MASCGHSNRSVTLWHSLGTELQQAARYAECSKHDYHWAKATLRPKQVIRDPELKLPSTGV